MLKATAYKKFQGGGHYDDNGQVILIAVMPNEDIAMVDASRKLEYIFDAQLYPGDVEKYVIAQYLNNRGRAPFSGEERFWIYELQKVAKDIPTNPAKHISSDMESFESDGWHMDKNMDSWK